MSCFFLSFEQLGLFWLQAVFYATSTIFIDEVDGLFMNREQSRDEGNRNITGLLLKQMSAMASITDPEKKVCMWYVMVRL